jgi:hypothetical protein
MKPIGESMYGRRGIQTGTPVSGRNKNYRRMGRVDINKKRISYSIRGTNYFYNSNPSTNVGPRWSILETSKVDLNASLGRRRGDCCIRRISESIATFFRDPK